MSIISSIRSNAAALNVQSAAIQVAGDNIANVDDPNYARKRAVFGEKKIFRSAGFVQTGSINIERIEQVRDEVLDRQIVRETMSRYSLEAKKTFLDRLEAAYGERISRDDTLDTLETGDEASTTADGLSKNLDDFFNVFTELSSSPTSQALKEEVMTTAITLVDKFNDTAKTLEDLSADLQWNIENEIDDVNRILGEIAIMNDKIGSFEVGDFGSATDLRDERQKKIEELSQKINFEVIDNFTNPSMVDIEISDSSGLKAKMVKGSTFSSELSLDSSNNTITFPKTSSPMEITGGSIHGMLEVRRDSIPTLQGEIDQIAHQLVLSVNAAYNPEFDDGLSPGPNYITTGDFFARPATGASVTATTIALDTHPQQPQQFPSPPNDAVVALSADTIKATNQEGGGNEIASAVAAISEYRYDGENSDEFLTGTFSEFIAGVTTRVGNEVVSTEEKINNQKAVDEFLETQRQSYSGVNLDEELTNLLQFQRSFQGTSRVINVLDSLLELVVSGLA